jgi:hypothetical protein
MEDRVRKGLKRREEITRDLKGKANHCMQCGEPGILNENLNIHYEETDIGIGTIQALWWLCNPCQENWNKKQPR